MKYYIYEEATYEVDADTPKAALKVFLNDIHCEHAASVEIHDRNVYSETQDDVTEEAEDQ